MILVEVCVCVSVKRGLSYGKRDLLYAQKRSTNILAYLILVEVPVESAALMFHPCCTFSRVSVLVHVLCKGSIERTFENKIPCPEHESETGRREEAGKGEGGKERERERERKRAKEREREGGRERRGTGREGRREGQQSKKLYHHAHSEHSPTPQTPALCAEVHSVTRSSIGLIRPRMFRM